LLFLPRKSSVFPLASTSYITPFIPVNYPGI
jgi:hypothetical protein